MPDSPARKSPRQSGLEALRQHRVRDAIELLSEHVRSHPDDVEASMELGLAELIVGERERFASRYANLLEHFVECDPATPRARALWDQCRHLGESMAAAAMLLTAAGIPATSAGCAKSSPPDPAPSVHVPVPVTVQSVEPVAEVAPPIEDAGEDASEPEDEPVASADASATIPPPVPPAPSTYSPPKTRYIVALPDPVPKLNP